MGLFWRALEVRTFAVASKLGCTAVGMSRDVQCEKRRRTMLSRIVLSFCQDLRHPMDAAQRRRFLRELRKEESLDREQIRAIQLRKIRKLLEYAYEHVPFYRRRFESRGIIPAEVRSFEDYAQIPVLTRQDIQEHRADLISRACDRADQGGGS